MGLTNVRMRVRATETSVHSEEIDFLVDSGALYTVLPAAAWRKLHIQPKQKVPVSLADGSVLEREVGFALLSYASTEAPCKVILGKRGDEPLLGATALESLGFVLDPLRRRIKPARIRM